MYPRAPKALIALLATAAALAAAGPGTAPAGAATGGCEFPASFFCQPLAADAPIDADSPAFVNELRNMAFGVAPHTAFDCRHAAMTDDTTQWTDDERQFCQ